MIGGFEALSFPARLPSLGKLQPPGASGELMARHPTLARGSSPATELLRRDFLPIHWSGFTE